MSRKSKFGASKLLTAGLAAVSAVMALSVSAFAGEFDAAEKNSDILFEVRESEIFYPEEGSSLSTGAVDLRSGKYERWIDRVVLPDELMSFYGNLYFWTDNNGSDDYLIDTSLLETVSDSNDRQFYAAKAFEIETNSQFSESDWDYYFAASRAAYDAFDRDHPEVFWLSGETIMITKGYYTDDGKIKYIFYFAVSSYDGSFNVFADEYQSTDAIRNGIAKREEYIEKIYMDEVHSVGNYQQVKAFNKWLTEHNEYNTIVASGGNGEGDMARECMSALEGRTGNDGPVCEAYARAMKVLCDRSGIPCILVDGIAGEAHMWNYIQMGDGNWYLVDSTWNDPLGGNAGAISGGECEDYLLIGSANTLIQGRTITNKASKNGVSFLNQPDLAVNNYVPSSDAVESAVLEADEGAVVWYIDNEEKVKQVNNGDKLEWGGGIRVEIPVSVAPTKPNIFIDNMLSDCYLDGDYWVTGKDEYYEVPLESKMTVKFNLQDGAIDFVERLYQYSLNRGSDFGGLSNHVRNLKEGLSACKVASDFLLSPEFLNSGLSNEEVVTRMYKIFLERDPDGSMKDWVKLLDNGHSYNILIQGIGESDEFTKICNSYGITRGNWRNWDNMEPRDVSNGLTAFIARLYNTTLGRNPDVKGLNDMATLYIKNKDAYELAYNFIFSPEFVKKDLSDSEYLDVLYDAFFGRDPDPAGKDAWLRLIQSGKNTREDVLRGFVGSDECNKLVAGFNINV